MRSARCAGGHVNSLPSAFWQPFASTMMGSAAGMTIARRNHRYELQQRRRGVIPKGNPATYWRRVYIIVEQLWLRLPDADKESWLYGRKPRGMTARDYFGHWNMNLVGRWGKWVRHRPPGMSYTKRKTDYPSSEALPLDQDACLFGAWHLYSGLCPRMSSESRAANVAGGSLLGAWNAAWASLLVKPWTPGTVTSGHNYGYVSGSGASYRGWAYQSRTVLTIGGLAGYAWRGQRLYWVNGGPAGGCTDTQYRLGNRLYGPERESIEWPDIRGIGPAERLTPELADAGTWAQPPAPGARYVYKGWYVGVPILIYEERR